VAKDHNATVRHLTVQQLVKQYSKFVDRKQIVRGPVDARNNSFMCAIIELLLPSSIELQISSILFMCAVIHGGRLTLYSTIKKCIVAILNRISTHALLSLYKIIVDNQSYIF
jgi:hypothetical protein